MSEAMALTTAEAERLAECEAIITRNLEGFYETGRALMRIRDERLYRAEYKTFQAYCADTWGFRRDYADKIIAAASVVTNLHTIECKPKNEAQARPLAKLAPAEQRAAWQEAVETAEDGEVTARHVEEIVQRRTRKVTIEPDGTRIDGETGEVIDSPRIPVIDHIPDTHFDNETKSVEKLLAAVGEIRAALKKGKFTPRNKKLFKKAIVDLRELYKGA